MLLEISVAYTTGEILVCGLDVKLFWKKKLY